MAALFLIPCSAMANLSSTPAKAVNGTAISIIPSELSAKGTSSFFIAEADGKVSVFDESFEKVASLSDPGLAAVEYQERHRRMLRMWGMEPSSYPETNTQFASVGDVRQYLAGFQSDKYSVKREEVRDEGVLFVHSDLSDYIASIDWIGPFNLAEEDDCVYEGWLYGGDGMLYSVRWIDADPSSVENSKFYEKEETVVNLSVTPEPLSVIYETEHTAGLQNNRVIWSQTLFNDDDEYECLVPEYSVTAINGREGFVNDYIMESVKGDTVVISGYSVVSQSGKRLSTVNVPSGYRASLYNAPRVISLKNNSYLALTLSDGNGLWLMLYAIDRSNSGLRSVSEPMKVSVSPTLASEGTPVIIDLREPNPRPVIVNVTSSNGTLMSSKQIAAGVTQTVIETYALPKGMYVVTVADGGEIRENVKIIIQ